MKIKQLANCSVAVRSLDPKDLGDDGHPKNYEFLQGTIFDLDEQTAKYLLETKVYADGETITSPDGKIIPKGTPCYDFIIVD